MLSAENDENDEELTLSATFKGEGGAGDGKVKEVKHPSLEKRVTRSGDGFDEGCTENRNRCRMSLQRLTQSSE